MTEVMDARTLARRAKASVEEVLYWTKIGAVRPKATEGGKPSYDLSALVALRTIKGLRERGVTVKKIRETLRRLEVLFPGLSQPFAEVKFDLWGKRLVIQYDRRKVDVGGQLLLDFSPPEGPRTLSFYPKGEEALFFRALRAEEGGDYEEAERLYREILGRDPHHPDALVNLGNIALKKGKREEAEALYRRALEADPDHVEANYNLACILEEKGRWQEALLFYKKALHEDPDFPEAHFNLARLLQALGRKEEAKVHWRRYLELDPNSPWAEWARRFLR